MTMSMDSPRGELEARVPVTDPAMETAAEAGAPSAETDGPSAETDGPGAETDAAGAGTEAAGAGTDAAGAGTEAAGAGSAQPAPFARVPAGLGAALARRGFGELTAVQAAVLAPEAEGRDLEISSQTGSGKTVALGFVIAAAVAAPREHPGIGPEALIIVPTRELAQQVREELGWLFADLQGVDVDVVTGGTPVYGDRTRLRRGVRVLVGTPGRLLDHVKSGALDLAGLRELVLDEGDQMLDMGFREDLEAILDATPEGRRTHLVSATFPAGIRRLAERYQRDALAVEGTRLGEANADIEHIGHLVRSEGRYDSLVNLLLVAGEERTLIFVERRAEALDLAELLERDGFPALPLSGELAQNQRDRTLAAFRDGRARVLVATDVAARGLDVPDVPLVVHMAPPSDGQIYTHRSGRTGRAGRSGRSVLFAQPSRRRKVARVLGEAGVDLTWQPIPSAREVRRVLRERDRGQLSAELSTALAAGVDEDVVDAARELVAEHCPADAGIGGVLPLVAALLARQEPTGRAQPREVDVLRPQDDRRSGRPEPARGRQGERGPRGGGSYEWGGRDERGGQRRSGPGGRQNRPRVGDLGAVRFFMNYGANQGATPGRLLAIACRRGDVNGTDIGSIAVHPNASTFDVNAQVAARFEDLAGRRDPRDPRILIRRDRGPAPHGARRQGGPGPR